MLEQPQSEHILPPVIHPQASEVRDPEYRVSGEKQGREVTFGAKRVDLSTQGPAMEVSDGS